MEIFQQEDSLLSADNLKDTLQGNYSFDFMNCHMITHNINDVYVLENQSSKYIFKIYHGKHRKLEEVKGEVELLQILHHQGVRVSYPIPDKNDIFIQNFNTNIGSCYGVLFSYAEGKVYYHLSDEQVITIGREMAFMHNITAGLDLKYELNEFNLNTLILKPVKSIKAAFKQLEKEYNYIQKTAEKIVEILKHLDLSLFGYGYCHYDLLPVNFHFDIDGNITLFDFNNAGKGLLINDLVSFYSHYFLQMMYGRETQEEVDHAFSIFINSYRKTRPISDEEINSIPYFGFAFWVYYIYFDYHQFTDRSSSEYLKQQVGWIKNWVNTYIILRHPIIT